ncbi:MAG TPA: acyl-CoA dehydrogenase family protein [Actinomycetota bacterium]
MGFFQQPPELGSTYRSDVALREHLERLLPPDVLLEVVPELEALGAAAATGGELARLAEEAEACPPRLVPFDPWGRRIDRVEVSAAWTALHAVQARAGLAAIPHEGRHGPHARVVQHALLHLYGPSSAVYSCPVAMTDAAVRVLRDQAPPALRDRVVPRLLSRDPERAWTSGQWMTERVGGSDLSRHATVARLDPTADPAQDGAWRLSGTKWFTSAVTADCALVLARPQWSDGASVPGSGGLGLFLVERVHPRTGVSQVGETILVNRLKDKLGTRALPTAELTLAGAAATPVGTVEAGVRKMAGMLNVTRVHNAVSAAAGMRRGTDLAFAYAQVREAFGHPLAELPLHRATLAALAVEAEAAFALVATVMERLGRVEHGAGGGAAGGAEREQRALRALVPLAKLLTAKDAVAHASEVVEAFGGAGYIEDSGIPRLLRDAQVLPIWEGTTNVLSLDLLRAQRRDEAVTALLDELREGSAVLGGPHLGAVAALVEGTATDLAKDVEGWPSSEEDELQARLRAFALRLGRTCAAASLAVHAAHRLARHGDTRAAKVAVSYATRWLAPGMPQ